MIRIYIGTEEKTEIACAVLKHSIRRRTTQEVEFTDMIGGAWEYPTDVIQVGTGFSLRRWMIPEHTNYAGKAIYLDADQIVLSDIAGLWNINAGYFESKTSAWMSYQPDKFNKKPWPQSSVMLIDCEAAEGQWGWNILKVLEHLKKNPTRNAYVDFMHCTWMKPRPVQISSHWNALNVYSASETKLLHYTSEPSQAWYKPDHHLAQLWKDELKLAIEAGVVTKDMLEKALAKWNVKEDWRSTNGLHPYYKKYVNLCPK